MTLYLVAVALHVLGASVWVGGHLVLAIAVLPDAWRRRDLAFLQAFEARFEKVGIPALLIQVVTGVWLAYRLAPDAMAWVTFANPVAARVGIKLLCLLATVVLAVHARLRLIPKLTPDGIPLLALHIWGVTVVSIVFAVVGAMIPRGL
jgi:putative copper export protein